MNGHRWIAAFTLGVEITEWARRMERSARCPHCGEGGLLGRPKEPATTDHKER